MFTIANAFIESKIYYYAIIVYTLKKQILVHTRLFVKKKHDKSFKKERLNCENNFFLINKKTTQQQYDTTITDTIILWSIEDIKVCRFVVKDDKDYLSKKPHSFFFK